MGKGLPVFALSEDLGERGVPPGGLVAGVQRVGRRDLAAFFGGLDRVIRG
jgi:hypothetical protein